MAYSPALAPPSPLAPEPHDPRSTGRPDGPRAMLAVLLLASTLGVMAGAMVAPVLQIIREDLGVARARQRFSPATLLRAAVLLWTLSYLVLGTVSTAALLPVALILYGAGLAIAFPTLTVLIGDTAPTSQRGQAIALSGTAGFFGQFISPLILGPLIAATTITTGFLTVAALTFLVLGVLLAVRAPTPTSPAIPQRGGWA